MITAPFILVVNGGGVITFSGCDPYTPTYWSVVGIEPETGEEVLPAGSLRYSVVRADASGRAANLYHIPDDPELAGNIDRIIVRHKADV